MRNEHAEMASMIDWAEFDVSILDVEPEHASEIVEVLNETEALFLPTAEGAVLTRVALAVDLLDSRPAVGEYVADLAIGQALRRQSRLSA